VPDVPDPRPVPAPLRVLDLTDRLAWSGPRLLVGLGADVVRVGIGGGDDQTALECLHWHAGKRLVEMRDDERARARLDWLAARADVVIESGALDSLRGLRDEGGVFRSCWPAAVHVVVTPFGLTGPRRHWRADDLVLASAGGMTWLGGRPGGQPKPPPREQACQLAGAHAAIGALLGVIAAQRTGRGQLIEISAQEAVAATLEASAITWIHAGRYPVRNGGVYQHVAHRIFATADGYAAGGYSGSDRMWTDLQAWMAECGEAADLTDPRWADPVLRWQGREHVDKIVGAFAARRTSTELAADGRARALPWAAVARASELLANPQLLERDFLAELDAGGDGPPLRDAGFPFEAPGQPRPVRLAPARPATADLVWPPDRGAAGRRSVPATLAAVTVTGPCRALDGLRVLDLTWVLAGPYATKQLAEHGADVIKIESRHRQDPTRFAPSMRLREGAGFDDSGYFLNFNRNKRSVAVNMRTEDGRDLVRGLAQVSDVVIENFSPGVLERWGLDYPRVCAGNPGVIVVSMAGVGQTGPWRDAVTFADTLAAMSGLSDETRDPGGPPQGLTFGLGDMVAANAAVLAVLDLVSAGRGGYVDLSQLEAMAAAMGTAVLEAQRPQDRPADPRTAAYPNRHPAMCPRGVYPVRGNDRWIAIAVQDAAAWRPLARLTDSARLAPLAGYDLAARRRQEDLIDSQLAAWTSGQDGPELAARLQRAGVAAALVNNGRDLVEADEQLAAREFYPVLEHPVAGPVRHEGIVVKLAGAPGALTTAAPLLGAHTDVVLTELLGLTPADLARLRDVGVLE
jgi:crotonobetainyl-CoA:carnitine CoA-transferase CaiB-like acyl-CoA transferase